MSPGSDVPADFRRAVYSMSDEQLRHSLDLFKQEHSDPNGQDYQLAQNMIHWGEAELERRHTPVIDSDGIMRSQRESELTRDREIVEGALGALEGNVASFITYLGTESPGLAAAVGGLFDAIGGTATGRNEFRAIHPHTPASPTAAETSPETGVRDPEPPVSEPGRAGSGDISDGVPEPIAPEKAYPISTPEEAYPISTPDETGPLSDGVPEPVGPEYDPTQPAPSGDESPATPGDEGGGISDGVPQPIGPEYDPTQPAPQDPYPVSTPDAPPATSQEAYPVSTPEGASPTAPDDAYPISTPEDGSEQASSGVPGSADPEYGLLPLPDDAGPGSPGEGDDSSSLPLPGAEDGPAIAEADPLPLADGDVSEPGPHQEETAPVVDGAPDGGGETG
jgi:hypothetical protein